MDYYCTCIGLYSSMSNETEWLSETLNDTKHCAVLCDRRSSALWSAWRTWHMQLAASCKAVTHSETLTICMPLLLPMCGCDVCPPDTFVYCVETAKDSVGSGIENCTNGCHWQYHFNDLHSSIHPSMYFISRMYDCTILTKISRSRHYLSLHKISLRQSTLAKLLCEST